MNINITLVLEKILNIMIWINENIFEKLNGSIRIDIFVGILGVLVAVVIFVAETLNSKNIETQKQFVLRKTKMKNIMIFSIFILTLCFVKEIIPYNKDCSNTIKIVFFVIELILNTCVFICIGLTIRLFSVSIKLNTSSDFFLSEYDKYVRERLIKIHRKNINNSKKKLKNESIKKFVKENERYLSFDLSNTNDYIQIKSNKSGLFKTYSCRTLQTIIDKVEEINRKNKELVINEEPLIILALKGGEKINRGVTIAYCKKSIKNYEDIISDSCILYDNIPLQDNEVNLIISDLFLLAENSVDSNFDSDGRLLNYYDFLYKNNMRAILENSYEYIRKIYITHYKNEQKSNQLANFLSLLAMLAYSNQDLERYKYLCNYIYFCYSTQLELYQNARRISYNFINSLFRYDYYSIKENSDSAYYDVLLSIMLNFLLDLLKRKEFESINDIFQNIVFDYNGIIDSEPDLYDIIKMQFSFGFIYGLIVLSQKNCFDDNDKKHLLSLIKNIKSNFVNVYSQNDAIYYFKKYYNSKSCVQNVYDNFDFKFEKTDYRNSWSGTIIDETTILKEYILIYDISFSNINNINLELITKDNKFFFEKMLELMKSDKATELETLLDIKAKDDSLINLLNEIIDKCTIAEIEYIKNNKISKEKMEKFKEDIFKEIQSGNELIKYLKKSKKIDIVDNKNNSVFGFNQIITREVFFDEVYGIENISKNYGMAINEGISKKYFKKLDSISEVKNENIMNYISSLKEKEDYVIIINPSNCRIIGWSNIENNTINIAEEKIDLIIDIKAKDIYLIKKNDLPKIEMQRPNIQEQGTIKGGIFYNLIDCSTNEEARSEIQKNTKWLEEKGDINEQIEFLKGNCVLKLFIAPYIKKVINSKCYKFNVEENEKS